MRRRNGRDNGDLVADMVKGAIAGAVATWVMDQVTEAMYRGEDPDAYRKEKEAQVEGKYAATVLAENLAGSAGVKLQTREQQYAAGDVVHYALGITPGAVYGALRNRMSGIGAGRGLLFGLGLFILEDEIANPLLGNTSGPLAYPWQAHWRGLVGHLVLGVVTDTVFEVLDQAI